MQEMALTVLSHVTASSECIDDIAANQVLSCLIRGLYTLVEQRALSLLVLHSLMGDTKLVKECLQFGGIVCLVHIFCGAQDNLIRERSADVLSKMSSDKLMGPKVRIALSKFLPEIFLDAMRKSVEACLQMFEGSHENPELIWNEKSRIRLNKVVAKLADSHSTHLKFNPEIPWVPSEADINALQSYDNSELVICGIYIRLFIANPGWVLRKPREFLTDLLETVLRLMGQSNPNMEALETVTTALVKLIEAQPALSDMVPATGYLSRILTTMNSADGDVQKPGVLIINELSRSELCVEAAAKCESIGPLKRALKLRSDLIYPTCEAFSRLFRGHHDTLIKQALYCNLVQDLLALLESPLRDQVSPSGTKALIVKALKDMQCSLIHGEEINNLLKSSPVWSQYESQKHDLFLPDYQNAGYLTANPGVAGYLTTTRKMTPNVPPPMDDSSNNLDNSNPLL